MSDDVFEACWDAWGSTAAHIHPPLLFSPSTLGPSSEHNTSRPESLPTNKIISNILLISQNYIKSLKVDEYTWQTIYFRGSIGRQPKHLAPVWHTPRQKKKNAPRHKMSSMTTIGMKLDNTALYHMHGMKLPTKPCMYFIHYILSTERCVIKGHHLRIVHCRYYHNCPSVCKMAQKEKLLKSNPEGGIMWAIKTTRNMMNFMLWKLSIFCLQL